jgi:hypothetical protein
MRVKLRTKTRMLRWPMQDILFSGEGNILDMLREIAFVNSESSFEACFSFKPFVYPIRELNVY